jgi:general L-amino acid transport system permease protein
MAGTHRRSLFRPRAMAIQIALLGALGAFAIWIAHNTAQNLAARNLPLGFDFLGETAGFAVSQSLISYSEQSSYARALLVGLLNTLQVAALGILAATLIGFLVGIARLSRNWLVARLALAYVETWRNVPLLLQLFVWYFAVLQPLPGPREAISLGGIAFLHARGLELPALSLGAAFLPVAMSLSAGAVAAVLLGRVARVRRVAHGGSFSPLPFQLVLVLGLPPLVWTLFGAPFAFDVPELQRFNFRGGHTVRPELIALFLGLSTYTASFIAETVRAGILAVSRGQVEAAAALGLSRRQSLRLVVLPLALRVIVPPLTSQYLNLTKNSSLAIAIGYPDLVSVFTGTALNQSGRAIEIVAITMAIYLALSLLTALLMNIYNARVALKGG